MSEIRIGIVGLGANTRLRHVPGFRACPDTRIVGVCNRREESTRAAAAEFDIPQTYSHWRELVEDDAIDAVMIGTWPYLHCEITIAALEAGKHVLTEARMARDLDEAQRMWDASQRRPELVTQVVPSPFGLTVHRVVQEMLSDGYLGELREVVVLGVNDAVADAHAPLHWRQSREFSGLNMLALGILHETLTRWTPDPTRVQAHTRVFTPQRPDPLDGRMRDVGTPDSARVLTEIPGGSCGLYHLSGAVRHGPGMQIHLYGDQGAIRYEYQGEDRVLAARRGDRGLSEVAIPADKTGGWRVEEEFINAIRGREQVAFTTFEAGVRYMRFTEAVARAPELGRAVELSEC